MLYSYHQVYIFFTGVILHGISRLKLFRFQICLKLTDLQLAKFRVEVTMLTYWLYICRFITASSNNIECSLPTLLTEIKKD